MNLEEVFGGAANSDGGARTTLVRRSMALRVRVVGILRFPSSSSSSSSAESRMPFHSATAHMVSLTAAHLVAHLEHCTVSICNYHKIV